MMPGKGVKERGEREEKQRGERERRNREREREREKMAILWREIDRVVNEVT